MMDGVAAHADAGVVSVSPLPSSFPAQSFVVGPDGYVWFTEAFDQIGRLNADGSVSEFGVQQAALGRIVVGPDRNLWYPASNFSIGRVSSDGTATILTAVFGGVPTDLAAGPDGNLWFTESGLNATVAGIVRMTTTGSATDFPLPAEKQPTGIAAGPDGNIWFTELTGNSIGRMSVKGHLKEFPLPRRGAEPTSIASGPDGNLWFTEHGVDAIGRLTPSGGFKEFLLPVNTYPTWIAAGPDGNVWFTGLGVVGRITPTGLSTIFAVAPPVPSGCSFGTIAIGPDAQMWTPVNNCSPQIVRIATR